MSYSGDFGKRKLYVGNLPPDIRHRDLDDLFYKFGKIVDIDIKDRKKPPFAFIEFDDPRDADDAVTGRNGYNYDGYRLRVEFPRGNNENSGNFHSRRKAEEKSLNRTKTSAPSRRSEFRVYVSGLPPTGSWQDLKDHMREAGDVGHADVFRDGTGVCEFLRVEDMKYAIKHLDDTKFKSHEGEISYIRVEEDCGRKCRSRSRSRNFKNRINGRKTPTYSPMRRSSPTYSNYSRSRSRSHT